MTDEQSLCGLNGLFEDEEMEGIPMPRDRKAVKERKQREEALDRKNAFGSSDPTPQAAVRRIIKQEQRAARSA